MKAGKTRRRAVVDGGACVACGCCVKVCPLQAVEIVRGIVALHGGACRAESLPQGVRFVLELPL